MSSRIILASTSASRKALLKAAGVPLNVERPGVDEERLKRKLRQFGHHDGSGMAMRLAAAKAISVSEQKSGAYVVGADQVLLFEGTVIDKPKSLAEARRQLKLLRGHTHRLVTAAAVARHGRVVWRRRETARLVMRNFSDDFLKSYLEAEKAHVTQTAGGYRLEALGAQLFQSVRGDYFGILGLPLIPLLEFLRREGALTV
ncbi:MAG: nucleoside triphosphate pyrophosphatase [Parvibaculaceae bacterium]